MRAGGCSAILAWHPDRLHRSPRELEDFIVLVEAHGVAVETVQAGHWDLTNPSGRLMARQLGSFARYESEHKAHRVRSALKQNAAMGRPHGAVRYGWRRPVTGVRDEIDQDAAAVIKDIADRVLRGESIRGIARSLNERGLTSPKGKRWSAVVVRDVVLREANAAKIVHRGEVVGDGDWPPILDSGTFEQVCAILKDPARRTATGTNARHLLSGVARCGVCGAPMRVALRCYTNSDHRTAVYRCSGRSCVSRNVEMLERLVTQTLVPRLAQPDAAKDLAPHRNPEAAKATKEAVGLQARLDNAADDYADGKINRRMMERLAARLQPKIEEAQARARVVDDAPLLAGIAGRPDAAEVWEQLPLTRRRAIVGLLLEVTVNRSSTRGGAVRFDPDDVGIVWKKS